MRWSDGITDSTDMSLSKLREFGDGQESLACCSPWGRQESDTPERLNSKILASKVDHMVIRRLSSMLERTLYFFAKIRENVGQCD